MAYQGDDKEFQAELIDIQNEILRTLRAILYNLEVVTGQDDTIDNIEDS